MGRHRTTAILVAVGLLAVGLLPASAGAREGDDDAMEQRYALGGAFAAYAYPPDVVELLRVEEAAGVASCGPLADAPVVAGGACFPLPHGADEVRVGVEETAPVPGDEVAFAAGFDGDGDGCVGCTPADVLERGWNAETLQRPDGAGAVAVFVYGSAADSDLVMQDRSGTGSTGLITVTPVDDGPSPEHAPQDHTVEGPSPHLCVPACT